MRLFILYFPKMRWSLLLPLGRQTSIYLFFCAVFHCLADSKVMLENDMIKLFVEETIFNAPKRKYYYQLGCYIALKMKNFLTHAATWMKLVNFMLSEISQSQKDKYL